jgi:hypothetical protein
MPRYYQEESMSDPSTTMDQSNRPVSASGTFQLGATTVHRLGYGAMQLTGPGVWGEPADRGECVRVLRRAVELGVDLIATPIPMAWSSPPRPA